MKATWEIENQLLDNQQDFNNSFYSRFRLRKAPQPLQLSDEVAKDYSFPTFYGNVSCSIGIFLCSYKKAEEQMLHPLIKPIKMPRGRSIVAFSCYEYKSVLGVKPYNEIAMTIPVMVDPGFNPPVIPMVLDIFKNFGYYVFSMPVTSLENQIRGHKIWGLPKVVQEIDIEINQTEAITKAYEESGEKYFELHTPTNGKPESFDVTSNLYSRLDDNFLKSETNFQGDFNVIKHMDLLVKKNKQPDRPYLTIGNSSSGQVLKNLEIEPHPFQFRFSKSMSSCFDLPEKGFSSNVSFK